MAKTPTQHRLPKPVPSPADTIPPIAGGGPTRVPLFFLLAAVTAMLGGLIWDIAWDASVGKDSFWSPPHLLLNTGSFLAWLTAVWLTVEATRTGQPATIRLWKGRAPTGAAFILWGGLSMLAWGVLDLWWTGAYGLFSSFWTPPQLLFSLSVMVILSGTFLYAISWRNNTRLPTANRAPTGKRQEAASTFSSAFRLSSLPVLWVPALLLVFGVVMTLQYNLPNLQRTALFYSISCPLFAFILVWTTRASGFRWAAVVIALVFTGLSCIPIWVFPLISATPLIGPVYQPISHLVPPSFPLLLLAPALAIDLIFQHLRLKDGLLSLFIGTLFVVVFVLAQWPFSAFLLSSASDNWLFAGGAKHWPFYLQIGPERTQFWGQEQSPFTAGAVVICLLTTIVAARFGLWLGRWTERLRR